MNTYDKGGLHFLDFSTSSHTFKINWLKQFRKIPVSLWDFRLFPIMFSFSLVDLIFFSCVAIKLINYRLYYLLSIGRFSWLGH